MVINKLPFQFMVLLVFDFENQGADITTITVFIYHLFSNKVTKCFKVRKSSNTKSKILNRIEQCNVFTKNTLL